MKKIFYLLAIVIVSLFTSCSTQKHLQSSTSRVDTVRVVEQEVVYKEKVHTVPDSASIKALFECNEKGEVLMKQILEYKAGSSIKPSITVKGDTVILDCNVDSLAIYHEFYGRFHQNDSISANKSEETKIVDKKPALNRWITSYAIILTLLFVGLLIYLKNKKN